MFTIPDSKDSGTGSSEDGDRGGSASHRLDLLHGGGHPGGLGPGRTESEWSESRADSGPDSPECLYDPREPPRHHPLHLHPHHPAFLHAPHHPRLLRHPSPERTSPGGHTIPASTSTSGTTTATKPRIWSLADMASKEEPNNPSAILGSPYNSSSPGGGKIVSPLASRLPPHHPLHPAMHPGSQFVRPHPDFYRNFYAAPHDMSLLEQYQRTLGGLMPPTSAPGALLASSSASSSTANLKSSPFSINGGGGSTGGAPPAPVLPSNVSPSASSTASSNGSDRSPSGLTPTELKSPGRV